MNSLFTPVDHDWIIVTPLIGITIGIVIIYAVEHYVNRAHARRRAPARGGKHRAEHVLRQLREVHRDLHPVHRGRGRAGARRARARLRV